MYNYGLSDTGGVRVMLDMAKLFVKNGIKVSLLVHDVNNVAFEVPDHITVYSFGKKGKLIKANTLRKNSQLKEVRNKNKRGKLSTFFSRSSKLVQLKKRLAYFYFSIFDRRSLLKNLEKLNVNCFISLNMYSNLEITELFTKISKTIIHVHNDPSEVYTRDNYIDTVKPSKLYNDENVKVVCISYEQRDITSEFLNVPMDKIQVVYNAIDLERIKQLANEKKINEKNYILGVGSLTKRKRFDRLVKSAIKNKYKLIILGDGPERAKLQHCVSKAKADEYIKFLGFQANPYPYIKNAKTLVMTSDSEGLPTVIIEALSLNVSVVSTDCRTGPRELLLNDEQFLVSLSQGENELLEELKMKIDSLPPTVSHDISNSVKRFSFPVVEKKWLEILSNEK